MINKIIMEIFKKIVSFRELIKINRVQISLGIKHHESFYTNVALLSFSIANIVEKILTSPISRLVSMAKASAIDA